MYYSYSEQEESGAGWVRENLKEICGIPLAGLSLHNKVEGAMGAPRRS